MLVHARHFKKLMGRRSRGPAALQLFAEEGCLQETDNGKFAAEVQGDKLRNYTQWKGNKWVCKCQYQVCTCRLPCFGAHHCLFWRRSILDLAHVKARFSARQNPLWLAVYLRQNRFQRTSKHVLAYVKTGFSTRQNEVTLVETCSTFLQAHGPVAALNPLSYGALEDPKLISSSQLLIAAPLTASPAAQAPPVAEDGEGNGVTMDPSSICTPDIDLMERLELKKEAMLDKTAVKISDADGLVAEKMILTCGLHSNMDSFTVPWRFWVLVSSRQGEETLLIPLMFTR